MATPTPGSVAAPTCGHTPPSGLSDQWPKRRPSKALQKRRGGLAAAASSGPGPAVCKSPEGMGCSEAGETSPQAPCPCPAAQRSHLLLPGHAGPTRDWRMGWVGPTEPSGVACGSWVLRFNHFPLRQLMGRRMGPLTQGQGVGEPGLDPVYLTLRLSPLCTPPLSPVPLLTPRPRTTSCPGAALGPSHIHGEKMPRGWEPERLLQCRDHSGSPVDRGRGSASAPQAALDQCPLSRHRDRCTTVPEEIQVRKPPANTLGN